MSSSKPICREAVTWTKQKEDRRVFAPFTGQDHKAFAAFVHLVELYLCSDSEGQLAALAAMRACLRAAQPKTHHVFKAAIPAVGDWGHEDEIWRRIII
jgi:hypothetical protein